MNNALRHAFLFGFLVVSGCAGEDDDGGGGGVDCPTAAMYFPDADGDGFGDDDGAMEACEQPAGFVAKGGDCADDNANLNPDKKEICDTIDNNCNGSIDDADAGLDASTGNTWFRDSDTDGFGDAASTKKACLKPAGYAMSSSDCDDAKSGVNPNAPEVCDLIDNDCDSKIDGADTGVTDMVAWYRDMDNDQHGTGAATMACSKPTGFVLATGDCNDNDNSSFPGGVEICDGADNDCDGGNDGTPALPNRCTGLVGTYSGSYSHLTQEKLGSTVINSMSCTGTGSGSLLLTRKPGIQGTFTCNYPGSLGGFDNAQSVKLMATVRLDGTVTGTAEHFYDGTLLKRTYNVTGTQTGTTLNLTGTGSWYPHPMSAVPWTVSFSFTTNR